MLTIAGPALMPQMWCCTAGSGAGMFKASPHSPPSHLHHLQLAW
jgi:hypothetical protein